MENVITRFYKAFNNLDAETMVSCYHDDIVFEDPAFGVLKGNRAKNMWRMLCESQKDKDFHIIYSKIKTSEDKGFASWEAFYTFSKTGRKVHNVIEANFEFKDGKVIKHIDTFNLYKWSKQALGLKGYLLGHTSFFKNKLQIQTNSLLNKFEKKKSKANTF
ncbi:nuclear transport factor 2 family protein [Psychroserpens sp. S379A]|uniref:nuclear transport factor 2 family protein n=1 Tax=Psychroserpens sp. S379A TaxID=3415137 RepID=UPI003C7B8364